MVLHQSFLVMCLFSLALFFTWWGTSWYITNHHHLVSVLVIWVGNMWRSRPNVTRRLPGSRLSCLRLACVNACLWTFSAASAVIQADGQVGDLEAGGSWGEFRCFPKGLWVSGSFWTIRMGFWFYLMLFLWLSGESSFIKMITIAFSLTSSNLEFVGRLGALHISWESHIWVHLTCYAVLKLGEDRHVDLCRCGSTIT